MRIVNTGTAGSLESSDVLITVEPNPKKGLEVDLQSNTESRFGRQMRQVIEDALHNLKVTDALVRVQDRSALDCTIRARLTAAVYRAAGITKFKWEEL